MNIARTPSNASIPLALTGLRVALAPMLLLLAWNYPRPWALALCLTLAFLSDVFDGIIARRLHVATATLRLFRIVSN
jgi:phosphatidylglycerophosphate synthase